METEEFLRRKGLIKVLTTNNTEYIGVNYLVTAIQHAKKHLYAQSAECIRLGLHFSGNDFLIRKYIFENPGELKINLSREALDLNRMEDGGEELFVKAYLLTLTPHWMYAQDLIGEYVRNNNFQSHVANDGDPVLTEEVHDTYTLYIMGLLKEKCGSPYEALQFYKKSLFRATEFCISISRLHYRIGVVKCQHYKYPLVGDFYKSIRLNKFNIYSYIALKKYLKIRGTELIIDEEPDNSEMAALLNSFNEDSLYKFSRHISDTFLDSRNYKIFRWFRQYLKELHDENSPFEDPVIEGEKSPTERDYSWNHDQFDELYGEQTYNDYNGTYAQDVAGFSDQDIRDAFGGQPDAYWNID